MVAGRKRKLGAKGQLLLVILVICAVLFAPTTIVLIFGMIPTFVAAFADRTQERMRGVTIGALNVAGCSFYILDLWTTEHTLEAAIAIITNLENMVVMWTAAGIGYCLEWAVTGTVSIYMTEMANNRISSIEKQQKQLIERWGKKVVGDIPLDENGFPTEAYKAKAGKDNSEPA